MLTMSASMSPRVRTPEYPSPQPLSQCAGRGARACRCGCAPCSRCVGSRDWGRGVAQARADGSGRPPAVLVGGRAGQCRLTHRVSGDSLSYFGDEEEVAVRIGDSPVAMPPELIGRLLNDGGSGGPDTLEIGVDCFALGQRGVEHDASAEWRLIRSLVRINAS